MKFIRKFTALALILTFIMNVNVMADNEVNYKNKGLVVKGNFAKDESKKQYSRVINSYTELNTLKKYIKKNYKNPNKYLKYLNNYDKSFFRKNSLVFLSHTLDKNTHSFKLSGVRVNGNYIMGDINKMSTLKEGYSATDVLEYYSYTYMIQVKKSDIKDASKVRRKFKFIYRKGYCSY